MQTGALPYWEAAVTRFPDNGRLRFGYANALWQDDQNHAALRAYRATVERTPDLAPAWNNLAYALRDSGHPEQAREAVCHARQLAPEDDNVADSVAEITDGRGC